MSFIKRLLIPGAVGAGLGALAAVAVQRLKKKPPSAENGAADDINAAFHASYDKARAEMAAPVMVALADALVWITDGKRVVATLTPPGFHFLKSVAHGPVALFVKNDPALAPALTASLRGLDQQPLDTETADHVREILNRSLAFLNGGNRDDYARDMGPRLLQLTEDATRLQLRVLDREVRKLLAAMNSDERKTFQVVVTGDHQARERSLGMQYFAKWLGKDRVHFGEGIDNEKDALTLIGTLRLDREIAGAFFGDEKRLQRDVLGDAAHRQLQDFALPQG